LPIWISRKFLVASTISDRQNGNQIQPVTLIEGGNPDLRPETGQSRTFGFVYSSKLIRDLQFAVTHWSIDEENNIQALSAQTIVNNESLFRAMSPVT